MKDRIEEIGRECVQAWRHGQRKVVLDHLSGCSPYTEIAPNEVAAVTAWIMSHLPTWLDQVEFRDELLDSARCRSQPTPAISRPK